MYVLVPLPRSKQAGSRSGSFSQMEGLSSTEAGLKED